ncbi:MAG: hypothetical protein ACKV0T_23065 [Planctomycetales bacterium]
MPVIQIVGGTRVQIEAEGVTIGSDSATGIAFPADPRLEPHHAVIRQVAGRWLIEAQGTRLFQIGSGVPTRMAWLSSGDCIKLSQEGPELIFSLSEPAQPVAMRSEPAKPVAIATGAIPAPAVPAPGLGTRTSPRPSSPAAPVARDHPAAFAASPSSKVTPTPRRRWDGVHPLIWALCGAGFVAGGLLLGIVTFGGGRQEELRNETRGPDSITRNGETPDESGAAIPSGGTARSVSSQADQMRRALGLIVARLPEGGPEFQVGTAFAISARELVTTGRVAHELQELRAKGMQVSVRSLEGGPDRPLAAVKMHPEFLRARAEEPQALEEYNALFDKIEHPEPGADAAELAALVVAAESRVFDTLQRQISFDLALLEIFVDWGAWLGLADENQPLAPGVGLTLWGLPIAADQVMINPEQPLDPLRASAQVLLRMAAGDRSASRLRVRIAENLEGTRWSGSPVLNGAGRAVGVYSRPALPGLDPADQPPAGTHDLVEVVNLGGVIP